MLTKDLFTFMKCAKRFLNATPIILSMSFALYAKADSKYSIEEILRSKIDEPAFINKVSACNKFDYSVAGVAEQQDESGAIKTSLLFRTNKLHDEYTQLYGKMFGMNSSNYRKYTEDPATIAFLGFLIQSLGKSDVASKTCAETVNTVIKHSKSKQRRAEAKQNEHDACIDARDYEGCIRVKSGKTKESSSTNLIGENKKDKCMGDICLVKSKGKDVYGLPKPMGWLYTQADDGRLFYFSKSYRIPHKGQENRYIGIKRMTRYYQTPKAGTSGTIIGGNTASTNCNAYNSSISCTTTGYTPTYIPGRKATPGGVSSSNFYTVYDCKDNTSAAYQNGRLYAGGWDTYRRGNFFEDFLKSECNQGVQHIKTLDPMYIKM